MNAARIGRFASDVSLVVEYDADGPAPTVRGPISVERAVRDVLSRFPDAALRGAEVNGAPGWTIHAGTRIVGVICAERRGTSISRLWIVLNPEKLHSWNRR